MSRADSKQTHYLNSNVASPIFPTGQPERLQHSFWICLSKVFQGGNWQNLLPNSRRIGSDRAEPCSPPRTPGKLPKKTRALWRLGISMIFTIETL